MTLHYLEPGDHFLISNQYNIGEFEYLGNFIAKRVKTGEQVRFGGHITIDPIKNQEENNE